MSQPRVSDTPAPNPPTSDSYEFGPKTHILFTARRECTSWGYSRSFSAYSASASGASRRDAGPIIAGLLYALIGFWTARAGSCGLSVAWTEGHDLGHLMAAPRTRGVLFPAVLGLASPRSSRC
ncbi:MAG: hypothetical protein U0794_21870 [Isosphaeraceae bacterium]